MEKKPVPGYEFYLASPEGEIWRVGNLRPLQPHLSPNGYLKVSLWKFGKGKTLFVHQLIAQTFHGPRPSERHHAAHRDGNKLNNTPDNVQWITKEENEADKIAHGRTNRGERNGQSKLSNAQVDEILAKASTLPRSTGGARLKKGALPILAREYGVTASCLRQIIYGQRRPT